METKPVDKTIQARSLWKTEDALSVIASSLFMDGLITWEERKLLQLATHVLFHAGMKALTGMEGNFTPEQKQMISSIYASHFSTDKDL